MRYLLTIPILLAVLLAACGGGGNGDKTATPASNATVSNPAVSTPSGDATPSADETAGAPAIDPFAGLQSYRYQMALTGEGTTPVTIKGTVKAPDSIALDFYLSDSDTPVGSMIIIGDKAWAKNAVTGTWEEGDITEAEAEITGLRPADFWGDFPIDEIIGVSVDKGEETVNDVKAQHYQINDATGDTLAQLAEIFGGGEGSDQPEKFSIDLWLASDGDWPLKATVNATFPAGSEITHASVDWQVTDVNSDNISIEPPA